MYSIQHIVSLLPEINYRTLKYLIEHLARFVLSKCLPCPLSLLTLDSLGLNRVMQHEEVTKMGSQNLAIVFGPNLLRAKEQNPLSMLTDMNTQCAVVEALIQQPVWMFSIERQTA